jgi:hypothetical protein
VEDFGEALNVCSFDRVVRAVKKITNKFHAIITRMASLEIWAVLICGIDRFF